MIRATLLIRETLLIRVCRAAATARCLHCGIMRLVTGCQRRDPAAHAHGVGTVNCRPAAAPVPAVCAAKLSGQPRQGLRQPPRSSCALARPHRTRPAGPGAQAPPFARKLCRRRSRCARLARRQWWGVIVTSRLAAMRWGPGRARVCCLVVSLALAAPTASTALAGSVRRHLMRQWPAPVRRPRRPRAGSAGHHTGGSRVAQGQTWLRIVWRQRQRALAQELLQQERLLRLRPCDDGILELCAPALVCTWSTVPPLHTGLPTAAPIVGAA